VSPLLLILLIGAGVAAGVAFAGREEYALSDDCTSNRLIEQRPEEVAQWIETHGRKHLEAAFAGRGSFAVRPAAGEPLPQAAVERMVAQYNALVDGGMSPEAARQLARIDGTTLHLLAEPNDPIEVALVVYQALVPPACRVVELQNWQGYLDGYGAGQIQPPTPAAECFLLALYVGVKLEMLAKTGNEDYQITPEDMARIAQVCPQPVTMAGNAAGGRALRAPGVSIGASELDFAAMARDANAGRLHPALILSGAVFR
jgi:hypothetical protein